MVEHIHTPGRTWFGAGVLQSSCNVCDKRIMRDVELNWIDLTIENIDAAHQRLRDRYGNGKGKKEKNNTRGFVKSESINSNLSK